ncbi:MAG: glycoside hydrolase family 3 C-terminal domain-containing protein [Bacteroidales bacterium]|nr:glycoside hydrolase family 3 C-terminal domain-containing protein [Bacteroidales bacterium]
MKSNLFRAAKLLLATVVSVMLLSSSEPVPIYLNTSYSFEERAADLVSRLTIEEKQSLLGNNMAAVPRLGIKAYNVWSEALHGVLSGANAAAGIAGPSSFPNSVAIGSSWDPDLAQRMASAITDEARAIFQTGTKGLTFWSPVVEPVRDPRWGRTGESYGEDPFLAAQIAKGFVRGFMGPDKTYLKAVPTAKHYFANNSEFDRHVSSSNMDSRDMREFYLYPYKTLIEQENLPSIMSSYNAVNGEPTTSSEYYIDVIARRTYGMKGYVTGDCSAVDDIFTGHYYVDTAEEAAAEGLYAGVDSDCGSIYQRYMISAYEQGLVSMAVVDRALVNMFTVRMRTGEFDPEEKVPYTKYPTTMVNSPANQALSVELATKTAVLLKNTNQALPLQPSEIKTIALIGPQADDVELGPYSGRPEQSSMISPYAGIKDYFESRGIPVNINLVSGADTKSKSNLLYVAYFEVEKTDGSVHRYDATQYNACSEGVTVGSGMGEEEQVRTIDDGAWTAYNNVDLTDIENLTVGLNIPTEGGIVEARVSSPEGNLVATIEATRASGARVGGVYGASMPMKVKALKLGLNEPQTLYLVYKAPADAPIDDNTINAAKNADVAVVFVGTDEHTATEEADRLTLLLPGNQMDLIDAVAAANKKTILVMQTLGCVEVDQFKDNPNIQGIIWTGYNGMGQGAAIAKVLFGDVNPGGKLNATWFKTVKDLPAITNYNLRGGNGVNGRTLWYFDKPVSYEFGYGLSYTTFAYSNFKISQNTITPQDKITVSVDVTNTGNYDGDEVVQIYMTTPDSPASLQRPIKRLKGFKRVTIARGQTKTVDIDIDCADLWFWDMEADKMTYDQGRYVFEVGSSSKDIRGTVTATMRGNLVPQLKVVVASAGVTVMNPGETAQAEYTAAMTDDSFYDVSKASVIWVSNNTKVAEVSSTGLVTAKSNGVATITARVSINGKTVSGSFPIKVMPNLNLASLTVGGKNVLKAGNNAYSYVQKAGAAPAVAAKAVDPALTVDVKQAASVPGTATVKVTDFVTYDTNEYVVNFGTKSANDEFKTLGSQWNWVREDRAGWSLTSKPGFLTITAAPGEITGTNNNAKNLLLQSANTDWTIDTKVVFSGAPGMPAQNAGIVAYQCDDNFVKFTYGAAAMGRGRAPMGGGAGSLQLVVEENGNQKSTANLSLAGIIKADNTLYMRLVKKGDTYTAYYSVDGRKFTQFAQAKATLKDIQAGLIACEGAQNPAMARMMPQGAAAPAAAPAAPFSASFDYFKISNASAK